MIFYVVSTYVHTIKSHKHKLLAYKFKGIAFSYKHVYVHMYIVKKIANKSTNVYTVNESTIRSNEWQENCGNWVTTCRSVPEIE